MIENNIYGLNCKLGDGFDKQFGRIIDFDAKPVEIKTVVSKSIKIDSVHELSSTDMISFPLGRYLEGSTLRILDSYILYDDRKYYNFILIIENRVKTCKGCTVYSANTEYHINQLKYGVHLSVIFPQTLFPTTKEEMKELLKSALKNINVLTEEQKKVKCKVLINTTETRIMTLEQVFRFKDEFLAGKHDKYQTIVNLGIKKHKELKSINVKNELDFKYFLSDLYICYRKIELKLEENGHPVTQIKRNHDLNVEAVLANLQNAKAEFKETNKNDFLRMYSIMKNLFYKYMEYIEFFIDHRLDIQTNDNLFSMWEDFNSWLTRLNDWEPMYLVYPSKYKFVKDILSTKFKNSNFEINDEIVEPMITVKNQHKKLFGIIKIRNPEKKIKEFKTAKVMDLPCPMKCSENERIWFCHVCAEMVKLEDGYTICNCGFRLLDIKEMLCNLKHQEDVSIQELPEEFRLIVNQLKKYKNKHDEVEYAVQKIIRNRHDNDLIKDTIQEISNLNISFDGDTKNLFEKFI